MNLIDVTAALTADTSEFANEFGKATESVQAFQKASVNLGPGLNSMQGQLDQMVGSIKSWGAELAKATPFAALGVSAFRAAEDLEQAFNRIRIQTGATGDALEGLKDSFRNIFPNVTAPAGEVAAALTEVHKRTQLVGPALEEMTTTMVRLASKVGGDVTSTVRSASEAFAAWNVPVVKQTEALNYLLRVSQQTPISFNELTASLKSMQAMVAPMGWSFEQTAAVMGKLSQAGIDSGTAIMSMRIAMMQLGRSGADASKGMQVWLDQIKNAKTYQEAFTLASEHFGRGAAQITKAVRSGALDVAAFVDELKRGGDTIGAMTADTMTFEEALKKFSHQFMLALEPLGMPMHKILDDILVMIKPIIGIVSDLAKNFEALPEPIRLAGVAAIGLAGSFGIISKAITSVVSQMQGFESLALGSQMAQAAAGGEGLASSLANVAQITEGSITVAKEYKYTLESLKGTMTQVAALQAKTSASNLTVAASGTAYTLLRTPSITPIPSPISKGAPEEVSRLRAAYDRLIASLPTLVNLFAKVAIVAATVDGVIQTLSGLTTLYSGMMETTLYPALELVEKGFQRTAKAVETFVESFITSQRMLAGARLAEALGLPKLVEGIEKITAEVKKVASWKLLLGPAAMGDIGNEITTSFKGATKELADQMKGLEELAMEKANKMAKSVGDAMAEGFQKGWEKVDTTLETALEDIGLKKYTDAVAKAQKALQSVELAIARGEKTYEVPTGQYKVNPKTGQPEEIKIEIDQTKALTLAKNNLKDTVDELTDAQDLYGQTIKKSGVKDYVKELDTLRQRQAEMKKQMSESVDAQKRLGPAYAQLSEEIKKTSRAAYDAAQAYTKLMEVFGQTPIQVQTRQISDQREAVAGLTKIYDSAKGRFDAAEKALEKLSEAQVHGKDVTLQYAAAHKALIDADNALAEAAANLRMARNKQSEEEEKYLETINPLYAQMKKNVKDATDVWTKAAEEYDKLKKSYDEGKTSGQELALAYDKLVSAEKGVSSATSSMNDAAVTSGENARKYAKPWREFVPPEDWWKKKADTIQNWAITSDKEIQDLTDGMVGLGDSSEEAAKKVGHVWDEWQKGANKRSPTFNFSDLVLGGYNSKQTKEEAQKVIDAYKAQISDLAAWQQMSYRERKLAEKAYWEAMATIARDGTNKIPAYIQKNLDKVTEQLEDHKSIWRETLQDVSTAFTDFGKTIADSLFSWGSANKEVQKQVDAVKKSLQDLDQSWTDYVTDYKQKMADLKSAFDEDISKQTADYKKKLADEEQAYSEFVAEQRQQLEEFRREQSQAREDEVRQVRDGLAKQAAEYAKFVSDTRLKMDQVRRKYASDLSNQMSDLKRQFSQAAADFASSIAEMTSSLNDFKAEQYSNLEEQKQGLKDTLKDQEDEYASYVQDVNDQISEIQSSSTDPAQAEKDISALRKELTKRTQEMQKYRANELKQEQELTRKTQEAIAKQTKATQEAIAKRTAEWAKYVKDYQAQQQELVAKNQEALNQELADLQKSLDDRAAEYAQYQADVQKQLQEIDKKYAEAMAKEEQTLRDSLAKRLEEYKKFLADSKAEFDKSIQDREKQYQKDLEAAQKEFETRRQEYEKQRAELQKQLDDTLKQFKSFFKELLDQLTNLFEEVGKTAVRKLSELLMESLYKKTIKPVFEGLIDYVSKGIKSLLGLGDAAKKSLDSVENLGRAMKDINLIASTAPTFPTGTGVPTPGSTPGTKPPAGTGAGAGAGSGISGVLGWVDAISGAVSAVANVMNHLDLRRMEQDLGRIEVTTRGMLNELGNLRKDEWQRHTDLFRKIDDVWNEIRTGFQVVEEQLKWAVAWLESAAGALGGKTPEKLPASGTPRAVDPQVLSIAESIDFLNSDMNRVLGLMAARIEETEYFLVDNLPIFHKELLDEVKILDGRVEAIYEYLKGWHLKDLLGGGGGLLGGLGGLLSGITGGIGSAIGGFFKSIFGGLFGDQSDDDIGRMERTTVSIKNELQNLRADEWQRHTDLFRKLDDIWQSMMEKADFLWNKLDSIQNDLKTISSKLGDNTPTAHTETPAWFSTLLTKLDDIWNSLLVKLDDVWGGILEKGDFLWNKLDLIQVAVEGIGGNVKSLVEILSGKNKEEGVKQTQGDYPWLTPLSDKLDELWKALLSKLDEVRVGLCQCLATDFEGLFGKLLEVRDAILLKLDEVAVRISKAVGDAFTALSIKLDALFSDLIKALLSAGTKEPAPAAAPSAPAPTTGPVGDLGDAAEGAAGAVNDLGDAATGATGPVQEAGDATGDLGDAASQATEDTGTLSTEIGESVQSYRRLARQFSTVGNAFSDFGQVITDAGETLKQFDNTVNTTSEKVTLLGTAVETGAKQTAQHIEGLSGVFDSFGIELSDAAASFQSFITQATQAGVSLGEAITLWETQNNTKYSGVYGNLPAGVGASLETQHLIPTPIPGQPYGGNNYPSLYGAPSGTQGYQVTLTAENLQEVARTLAGSNQENFNEILQYVTDKYNEGYRELSAAIPNTSGIESWAREQAEQYIATLETQKQTFIAAMQKAGYSLQEALNSWYKKVGGIQNKDWNVDELTQWFINTVTKNSTFTGINTGLGDNAIATQQNTTATSDNTSGVNRMYGATGLNLAATDLNTGATTDNTTALSEGATLISQGLISNSQTLTDTTVLSTSKFGQYTLSAKDFVGSNTYATDENTTALSTLTQTLMAQLTQPPTPAPTPATSTTQQTYQTVDLNELQNIISQNLNNSVEQYVEAVKTAFPNINPQNVLPWGDMMPSWVIDWINSGKSLGEILQQWQTLQSSTSASTIAASQELTRSLTSTAASTTRTGTGLSLSLASAQSSTDDNVVATKTNTVAISSLSTALDGWAYQAQQLQNQLLSSGLQSISLESLTSAGQTQYSSTHPALTSGPLYESVSWDSLVAAGQAQYEATHPSLVGKYPAYDALVNTLPPATNPWVAGSAPEGWLSSDTQTQWSGDSSVFTAMGSAPSGGGPAGTVKTGVAVPGMGDWWVDPRTGQQFGTTYNAAVAALAEYLAELKARGPGGEFKTGTKGPFDPFWRDINGKPYGPDYERALAQANAYLAELKARGPGEASSDKNPVEGFTQQVASPWVSGHPPAGWEDVTIGPSTTPLTLTAADLGSAPENMPVGLSPEIQKQWLDLNTQLESLSTAIQEASSKWDFGKVAQLQAEYTKALQQQNSVAGGIPPMSQNPLFEFNQLSPELKNNITRLSLEQLQSSTDLWKQTTGQTVSSNDMVYLFNAIHPYNEITGRQDMPPVWYSPQEIPEIQSMITNIPDAVETGLSQAKDVGQTINNNQQTITINGGLNIYTPATTSAGILNDVAKGLEAYGMRV